MRKDFSVRLNLRIDWSELDLMSHVNNVVFLKYAQSARVNYWEQIGLYQHLLKTKEGPMLASVTCQFRKQLLYPGSITIYTRMKSIGNTSFCLQHEIVDEEGDVTAEVEDVLVMFDFNNNEKMPFLEKIRKNVEELEGKAY